ncbi:MAG TPA: hypothetical protein VMM93_02120 [Vicinamibacterales bacterium]|nr:hypothetical protein [Vicinamibacterales bacterium]
MHPFTRRLAGACVAATVVVAMTGDGRAQTTTGPTQFTAQLINLNTQLNLPQQSPVDIVVARWSTAGERELFVTALKEGGPEGLLKRMQELPRIGSIRIPGSLNYEFQFALRGEGRDGGQSITLITDRPVSFEEAVDRARTLEYRFLVIQLQINPIGRGEGRISIATRVTTDRITGEINLDTWENLFVTLRDVRRTSGR